MSTTVQEYVDVASRAEQLGCSIPTMIAVLPRNFSTASSKDELVHESNAATIRTILRNEGITETPLEVEGERFPFVQENDFTWIGPVLFFTAAQLLENQAIVSVSLGVVGNYLTDFFRGVTGKRRVLFDVVVEQTKTKKTVRIHYDGDVDGFVHLANSVNEIVNNE